MMEPRREGPHRRLAAVWFADIVGFTALSSRDEARSLRLVEHFEAAVRAAADAYDGTVVKFMGDGTMVHFPSTDSALRAALDLRARFSECATADGFPGARLRVGVHVGDILIRADADLHGDGVNVASRLQSAALPGEVVVSEEVWRQLRHTGGFEFRALGMRKLKGLDEPRQVYSAAFGEGGSTRAAPVAEPGWAVRGWRAALLSGVVAVAFAAGAAMLMTGGDDEDRGRTAAAVESVVVLPFDDLSATAEDYFADGMHDALIGELTEIGSLRVISRTSSVRYRGSTASLAQIARELDVDAVVAASVLRAGDNVRIRAELIRVFPQEQSLWAATFDRELRDVLALHSDLARALADAIRIRLTPGESARLARGEVVNPDAYEAYLQGRFRWNLHTERDLEQALVWFERALEHDPDYAPAYAGIASVWYGRRQMGLGDPAHAAQQARVNATRALELDDTVARAHEALAVTLAWHDWDWAGAERHFVRALELNPGDGLTRSFYSLLLRIVGRDDEGAAESTKALQYDPHNPIVRAIDAGHLLQQDDDAGALAGLRAALDDSPNHPVLMRDYVSALVTVGEHDAALAALRALYAVGGDTELVAVLDGAASFEDAMRGIADTLAGRASDRYLSPARVGRYYYHAGDIDRSLDWFERAVATRDHGAPHLALRHLKPLRSEPRFRALLEAMGLR